MSRPRNSVPTYLRHASGRARVAWTDSTGNRRFQMLPGLFDSPESKAAYRTFLAELDAAPHHHLADEPNGITVNGVLLAYLDHADRYYRTDGKPTDEPRHVRTVCRVIRELYGDTPAAKFGPLALKAVRQQFIARGWCRKSVNRQTDRVRQIFKWAVAEQLVPPSVQQALGSVTGLRKDRTTARESEPVAPVDDAVVDATLPHLNRALVIRALMQYYIYYGNDFTVECPTGSGQRMNLYQVAEELSRRLCSIFLRDKEGQRPVYGGTEKFQNDPHWRDLILFYEYFHGDNGAGLGASHQTGWTGIVARTMHMFATTTSKQAIQLSKLAAVVEVRKPRVEELVGVAVR